MAALHFTFLVWAYVFAGVVLTAMILWIAVDYRGQKKKLADLEAKRGKK